MESNFHKETIADILRARPGCKTTRCKEELRNFIRNHGDCKPEDHGAMAVLEGSLDHGPSIVAKHTPASFRTNPDAFEVVDGGSVAGFIFYEVTSSNGLRYDRMWHYASLGCAFDSDSACGMMLIHYDGLTDTTSFFDEEDLCWLWYDLNDLPPRKNWSDPFKPREHILEVNKHRPYKEAQSRVTGVAQGLNFDAISKWIGDWYD